MVTREDFESAREDLIARREALMARAEELREQFGENVDADMITMTAGLALFSGGIAWAVTMGMRGKRGLRAFVAPAALILAGVVIAGRGGAHKRDAHIFETEARVREELSGLDPFARVRVLKDLATEQLSFLRQGSSN